MLQYAARIYESCIWINFHRDKWLFVVVARCLIKNLFNSDNWTHFVFIIKSRATSFFIGASLLVLCNLKLEVSTKTFQNYLLASSSWINRHFQLNNRVLTVTTHGVQATKRSAAMAQDLGLSVCNRRSERQLVR